MAGQSSLSRVPALVSAFVFLRTIALSAQSGSTCKGVDFLVDGLTGEVRDKTKKRAWFVGETVVVRVHRANLLHYGYLVHLPEASEIVLTYGIVGVGIVASGGGTIPADATETSSFSGKSEELLREIQRLQTVNMLMWEKGTPPPPDGSPWPAWLIALIADLVRVTKRVEASDRSTQGIVSPVATLDATFALEPCAGGWGNGLTETGSVFSNAKGTVVDSLAAAGQEIRRLRKEIQGLRLMASAANVSLPSDSKLKVDLRQFATLFDSLLIVLDTRLTHANASIGAAGSAVARWHAVMKAAPGPYRDFRFPVTRSNRRQPVVIRRYSVSPIGKAAQAVLTSTLDAVPKADTVELATLSYDIHSHSRFNLSTGLAGLYTPESQTFGAVSEINAQGLVEMRVRRIASNNRAVRPAVLFGVYFNRVDELDSERPLVNAMVTIGAEIAGGGRNYLFGLGLDSRDGVQVGLGATLYESTKLASGWQLGQALPLKEDGTAVVATVPTRTRRFPGAYVYLGFRPVFVEKFANALGKIF